MADFGDQALSVALRAAVESSVDLGDFTLSYDERGERNEQWVHSYVGCRLNDAARAYFNDQQGIYVTYEARASWLPGHTGAIGKRGPKSFVGGERFDIGVWNSCGFLEGLVEVKDAPAMDQNVFVRDTKRIVDALDCWGRKYQGSLRWGLALFSCRLSRANLDGDKRRLLRDQFEKRVNSIKSVAGRRFVGGGFSLANEQDESCSLGWGAALFI